MATKASWIEYLARFGTPGHEVLIAAETARLRLSWKYDLLDGAQAVASRDTTRALVLRRTSGSGLQGHLTIHCKRPQVKINSSGKAPQMDHPTCKTRHQDSWAYKQPACQVQSQKPRTYRSFRIFQENGDEVRLSNFISVC